MNATKPTIYVICPAYSKTGGPELLHQLVFALNELGLNATIAYTSVRNSNPTNPEYKRYISSYISLEEIEDNSDNIIIISELQIELLSRFKYAKIAVWWLSVDNYFKVYSFLGALKLIGIKGVLWYIKNRRWRYRLRSVKNKISYNFAQSYYAMDFLKENNFRNVEYLSDYINDRYLNISYQENRKKNVVLYNPKKGIKFTKYLISLDKSLNWVPLENLSGDEVRDLLLRSKVYIDFGNHPGKDRFPREAAMCGCCIITSKNGSARYYKDVPILDIYKFDDKLKNAKQILDRIHDCLDNYEIRIDDFSTYRKKIRQEKQCFNEDVRSIFFERKFE